MTKEISYQEVLSLHTIVHNLCMDTCLSVDAPAVLILLPAIQLCLHMDSAINFPLSFGLASSLLKKTHSSQNFHNILTIWRHRIEQTVLSSSNMWCTHSMQYTFDSEIQSLEIDLLLKSLPRFSYYQFCKFPLLLFCWRYSQYHRMTMKKTVQPVRV